MFETIPLLMLQFCVVFTQERQTCDQALGMASGEIQDNGILVSTELPGYEKQKMRFGWFENETSAAWCPLQSDRLPSIEIHLPTVKSVSKITFQLPSSGFPPTNPMSFMTKFSMEFVPYFGKEVYIIFKEDMKSILNETIPVAQSIIFDPAIVTNTLRFTPTESNRAPCFRMEIYGCNITDLCPDPYCVNDGRCAGQNLCHCPQHDLVGEKCQYKKPCVPITAYNFTKVNANGSISGNPNDLLVYKGKADLEGVCGRTLHLTHGGCVQMPLKELCYTDLDNCFSGFTISLTLKQDKIIDPKFFLSTGGELGSHSGLVFYYSKRTLIVTVTMSKRSWRLARPYTLLPDTWYWFEVSWTPNFGLSLYVNGQQVSHVFQYSTADPTANKTDTMTLGCSTDVSSPDNSLWIKNFVFASLRHEDLNGTIYTGCSWQQWEMDTSLAMVLGGMDTGRRVRWTDYWQKNANGLANSTSCVRPPTVDECNNPSTTAEPTSTTELVTTELVTTTAEEGTTAQVPTTEQTMEPETTTELVTEQETTAEQDTTEAEETTTFEMTEESTTEMETIIVTKREIGETTPTDEPTTEVPTESEITTQEETTLVPVEATTEKMTELTEEVTTESEPTTTDEPTTKTTTSTTLTTTTSTGTEAATTTTATATKAPVTERNCQIPLWQTGIIKTVNVVPSSNAPDKVPAMAEANCCPGPVLGGWCPDPNLDPTSQYIEVTFDRLYGVKGIEIQPPEGTDPFYPSRVREYMTNYTFQYAPYGVSTLTSYNTQAGPLYMLGVRGNIATVVSTFTEIVGLVTDKVKISIVGFVNEPCFRFDIFGCEPENLCNPRCENGGTCIYENTCACPPPFFGPGCKYSHLPLHSECLKPLGMWNEAIKDTQLVASSSRPGHSVEKARYICCLETVYEYNERFTKELNRSNLKGPSTAVLTDHQLISSVARRSAGPIRQYGEDNGSWCPSHEDKFPYYEVHLDKPYLVAMLMFQPPSKLHFWEVPDTYMKAFTLQYRNVYLGVMETYAVNIDAIYNSTTSSIPTLDPFLLTDVIRIVPSKVTKEACFRFEIIGCDPDEGPDSLIQPSTKPVTTKELVTTEQSVTKELPLTTDHSFFNPGVIIGRRRRNVPSQLKVDKLH